MSSGSNQAAAWTVATGNAYNVALGVVWSHWRIHIAYIEYTVYTGCRWNLENKPWCSESREKKHRKQGKQLIFNIFYGQQYPAWHWFGTKIILHTSPPVGDLLWWAFGQLGWLAPWNAGRSRRGVCRVWCWRCLVSLVLETQSHAGLHVEHFFYHLIRIPGPTTFWLAFSYCIHFEV